MLVFVWRLLETLGYIEYKQEWDKESWSRSLGSLRSTLTLHAWMKMNMREKDSKRHSHTEPEGAPGRQGERTPGGRAQTRPSSAGAGDCPARKERLLRHKNL